MAYSKFQYAQQQKTTSSEASKHCFKSAWANLPAVDDLIIAAAVVVVVDNFVACVLNGVCWPVACSYFEDRKHVWLSEKQKEKKTQAQKVNGVDSITFFIELLKKKLHKY